MAVIREKQVLEQVLKKYRDLPALWDQSHEMYGNKLVRKEGYQTLLEIYRLGDPNMDFHEFKKKLENMRTTYRRERVKVLKSRMNGEDYVPSLWYYHLYTFLDDIVDGSSSSQRKLSTCVQNEERLEEERLEEEVLEEVDYLRSRSNSPPPKKKKKQNIIFLADDDEDIQQIQEIQNQGESYAMNDHSTPNNLETSSVESFGKTIGLQLNELKPFQRFVAEKLISEIIFYGRLEKLRPETKLSV